MKEKPKKIVWIRRKFSFIEEANNDPAVKDYFDMAFRAIGSQYRVFGKIYETGLTRAEENILMPEILGLYPDDDKKSYRKAIQEYYRNINTKVPSRGLRLEISLEDDSKELSEDNPPINIDHYLRYKHALKHLQVGKNLDEAEKYQHILFYIDDPSEQTKDSAKVSDYEDEARIEYFKIVKNEEKVDMVLTLMGIMVNNLSLSEKKLKLKAMASIRESLGNDENIRRLSNFSRVAKDKEMAIKYEITNLISGGILEKVGSRILISESGDVIGDNIKEAVLWFKDKGNSREVNVFRARLRELTKPKKGNYQKDEDTFDDNEEDEVVIDGIELTGGDNA